MQGAIIYQWRGTVAGREAASMELWRDADARLQQAVGDGRIADYAWYISGQGDLNFLVVRAEMEKVAEFANDPETVMLNTRGDLINTDFHWGYYATGEAVPMMTDMFEKEAAKLR